MSEIIYENQKFSDDILNIEDSKYFYEKNDISNNRSQPILSKYEKTKVIFERMQMITNGGDSFIENPEKYPDLYSIVLEELNQKKIPFIIKRNMGNNFEYWKLEDLIII